MNIAGFPRVGKLARSIQIIRIFLKEKDCFTIWIMAHFDRVIGIVAADTVDTTHRKKIIATF